MYALGSNNWSHRESFFYHVTSNFRNFFQVSTNFKNQGYSFYGIHCIQKILPIILNLFPSTKIFIALTLRQKKNSKISSFKNSLFFKKSNISPRLEIFCRIITPSQPINVWKFEKNPSLWPAHDRDIIAGMSVQHIPRSLHFCVLFSV